MEAYKFKTKVSENGTIVVPDGFDVKNKEVEVIILLQGVDSYMANDDYGILEHR
jgi:hypothetical protein